MPNPKILFIGSNPSNKASNNEAFTADTASGRLLRCWIEGIKGTFYYENIVSQKTENNRPLNKSEMALATVSLLERIKGINPDRIIALGKSATDVVKRLGLEFLEMPHPSGMCRFWNDKEKGKLKIEELRKYIQT